MKISGFELRKAGRSGRAFTLIEIMLVVLIMGIVMAAGIPSLMSATRKEGIRQGMNDVVTACQKARERAIMSGRTAQVHFRPQDGTITVEGASTAPVSSDLGTNAPPAAPAGPGFSEKLPENIAFEMLDINLTEYNAADDAYVRFFADGRCDEMVVVLLSDKNEQEAITLEITTGLTTVYDDPKKLLMQ